jgi:APA family basic amino acid/polyamine antiporter
VTGSGLKRILGLAFGLAVIVGTTLGVGILRAPGLVAAQISSPPVLLAAWVAGGLYTLLAAVCLAELGTMLPEAGGYYVYARHAFGDTAGFAVGWADWLTYCSVAGYVSIGIGEFSALLVPALAPWIRFVAVAVLLALVALQWAGLRVSSRFQEITTAAKFAAFVIVIGAALAAIRPPEAPGSAAAAPLTIGGLIAALQAVVITYGGWQSALYFTEEDRDPSRNLPRAMVGGVAAVIAVYALVNLALLRALPAAALARSTLPAADAAQALFGARGRVAITLLSLVSLPPLINAIMMIGSRVLFAMGRDGLVWRRTAIVTAGGTPGPATLLTTAIAVGLIATGTFQTLIAMTSFFLAANYAVCCAALIVLRRREPARPRPFRAWGYPWSAALVLAGALAFLAGTVAGDPRTAAAALALVLAGLAGRTLNLRMRRRAAGRAAVT